MVSERRSQGLWVEIAKSERLLSSSHRLPPNSSAENRLVDIESTFSFSLPSVGSRLFFFLFLSNGPSFFATRREYVGLQ